MAKLTREQWEKFRSQAPENWIFDAQHFVAWGEKTLAFKGPEDETGKHYVIKIDYQEERTGEGWTAKKTGRQIPVIRVERYTPTGNGMFCSVVQIFKAAAGEPQKNKNYNYMCGVAATLDTDKIIAAAAAMDNGRQYETFDFNGSQEARSLAAILAEAEPEQAAEVPAEAQETPVEGAEEMQPEETTPEAETAAEREILEEKAPAAEEAEPEAAPEEAAAEPEEETAAAAEIVEIIPEESETPLASVSFSAFADLAKAYAEGKKAPKQPTPAPAAEEEPTPEEIDAAEEMPAEAQESPLYSDIFTRAEIAALQAGNSVKKEISRYTVHYFGIRSDRNNAVFYVYKQETYSERRQRIGKNNPLNYAGFIFQGRYYTDADRIITAFKKAVNAKIIEMIPTEEDARKRAAAADLPEWKKDQIRECEKADYTDDARRAFFEGIEPELILTEIYRLPEAADAALLYITNPSKAVQMYAESQIEGRESEILTAYIRYDKRREKLDEIRSNPEDVTHKIKRMADAIQDEKTVRITTTAGQEYRVNASAIKHLKYSESISKWESGVDREVKAAEITRISHGSRILYSA